MNDPLASVLDPLLLPPHHSMGLDQEPKFKERLADLEEKLQDHLKAQVCLSSGSEGDSLDSINTELDNRKKLTPPQRETMSSKKMSPSVTFGDFGR